MSTRALTRLGWLLVAVGGGCLIALQWLVLHEIDRWDGWLLALLLQGALGCGVAAHGLCWRRGGATLQGLAQLVAAVAVVAWLYTWFEPLGAAVAWVRLLAYRWFGP